MPTGTASITETGTDRGFYEFCALAELKNALRSGDMWVTGSRQFRDFEDYLLAGSDYTLMKSAGELPLVTTNGGPGYASTNLVFLIYRTALLGYDVGGASAGGIIAIILANIVAIFLMRAVGKNLDR